MITLYVNKKPHNIPVSWEELTFEQYVGVLNGEDKPDSYFMAVMIGMDYEEFKKCDLKGFEQAMTTLAFLKNNAPKWLERPSKIGNYILPADLTLESVGQYEDMKALVKGKKDIKDLVEQYPKVCAIYCQKARDGEFDFTKAMAMAPEFNKLPAREVVETASFFLAKVILMTLGTPQNSLQQKKTPIGKLQTTSTKRSGSHRFSGRSTKNTRPTKKKRS